MCACAWGGRVWPRVCVFACRGCSHHVHVLLSVAGDGRVKDSVEHEFLLLLTGKTQPLLKWDCLFPCLTQSIGQLLQVSWWSQPASVPRGVDWRLLGWERSDWTLKCCWQLSEMESSRRETWKGFNFHFGWTSKSYQEMLALCVSHVALHFRVDKNIDMKECKM